MRFRDPTQERQGIAACSTAQGGSADRLQLL